MSTSVPITAQSTIVAATPADNKGSLKGKQPPVFNGTRAKADNFWRAFKIYRILNKESNAIKKPFNQMALALSFIAGPNVDDWSEHQLDLLEEKISTTNLQRYTENDERLWTEFETDFQNAFQDTTRTQDAYTALMQLKMKGKDIDTYITTFDRLVGRAGWSTSDKGVMEKFRNGLAQWLALDIMRKYKNIPDTLEKWKDAAKKEILRNAQINTEMPSRNTGGMPYPSRQFVPSKPSSPLRNNVTTGPAPPRCVPMEVDAAQLRGPLTPEERKRLFDENWCFYCRDKGHRSARCWKKPGNKQSGPMRNPFTRPTTTNPFRARAAALEGFSDTASTAGTIISQPTSSREEIT
jgi:hypothetical protein